MEFNEELRRLDELIANLAKRDEAHASELAAKAKALAECEVARSSELELMERLKANCNEMRSQQSMAEKQFSEMEVKLSEVEEKNQQLAEQTNDNLTQKVNRCLCGFVIWQITTQKWLQLRDLECCVTAMTSCNVSGQCDLARKLDVFLFGLDDTKDLELDMTVVLRRLGLDWNLEGAATVGSVGGAPEFSS